MNAQVSDLGIRYSRVCELSPAGGRGSTDLTTYALRRLGDPDRQKVVDVAPVCHARRRLPP